MSATTPISTTTATDSGHKKPPNYFDDNLRIALVLTPLNDQNLALAAQISVTDIIYYNMDTMPMTVEELQQIKVFPNKDMCTACI